jgi:hypothetical protein
MRAVVLGGIALAVLLTPAEARQSVCWPAGSSTLSATREARVYVTRRGDTVACSYRFHRRVKLDLPYSDESTAPYVVNRRYVLFGSNSCEGAAGCYYEVAERDLRTGRVRFDLVNGGVTSGCNPDNGCGVPVAIQVLLRRDGSAAWIACDGNIEEPPAESECNGGRYVQIADGRGGRIADRGKIPPHSLHFNKTHRRVLWTNGGKRRSARIYFSAAGQTIR